LEGWGERREFYVGLPDIKVPNGGRKTILAIKKKRLPGGHLNEKEEMF